MHRLFCNWFCTITVVTVLLVCSAAQTASAVLLFSSNQRNTTAPGSINGHGTYGDPHGPSDPRRLFNSGWQWQGHFGDFLGTPIASQYFITAKHAGATGPSINIHGTSYPIDFSFNGQGWRDDPNSDLRIWKISNTFSSWAPLYTGSVGSEVGQPLVVFGRGVGRGAEVRVGGELKGWQWEAFTGPQPLTWGENVVSATFNAGGGFGQVLGFNFDRDGGPNEAALSDHDSSGAVFIQSGGAWRLAGINLAVSGPYRFTQAGSAFNASIFDAGGLWVGSTPQFVNDGDIDVPGTSYSTMISANLAWIQSVVGTAAIPEPASGLAFLGLLPLLVHRGRR